MTARIDTTPTDSLIVHLERAIAVAKTLEADGHRVTQAAVTVDGPEVWITGRPSCHGLGGTWYRRSVHAGRTVWTYVALVGGVQVKWRRGC